jgi:hypothetical protein
LLVLLLSLNSASAAANRNQEVYDWPEIYLVQVAPGFSNSIGITHAGDGSRRLFILEQSGTVRIIRDGRLLPQPFLDIREKVSCCGERGLLGLAFPPDYASKGYFYVNYTLEFSPVW